MRKVLESIFATNKFKSYSLKESKETSIYLSDGNRTNFFIHETFDLAAIDDTFINTLVTKIKAEEYWKTELIKNTVILFLFNSTESNSVYLQNQIQRIEEDKYGFKKYVLDFSSPQLQELLTVIKNDELDSSSLNKLLADKTRFNGFAKEKSLTSYYELLLKIFIKLPFLKLETATGNFESLESQLLQEMGTDLATSRQILKDYAGIEKMSETQIETILLEEIEED